MASLSPSLQDELKATFGDRVSFDRIERKLYSHDIAAVPPLAKPLLGGKLADAVTQPTTEEELVQLARWAQRAGVPLTPRGKASSGYGGAVPYKGGVVVDFGRLKRVIAIDADAGTATVEAGINWESLEAALAGEGLCARQYPTSAPGSTIGGWVAQGGAGIGSYEFGWFRDALAGLRIVTPEGEIRELTGDDIDLAYAAEGITGFVSRVTLRVEPAMDLRVVSIAYADSAQLTGAMAELVDHQLPVWSVTFINPTMARFKNEAPEFHWHYEPPARRLVLPDAYVVTLAYRSADQSTIDEHLPHLLAGNGGTLLPDEVARHEWENRFKLMTIKRLGPSLVPAEVVVPLERLGEAIERIGRLVEQPIVKEGIVIRSGRDGKPEAVILGFIPADQRKFAYNFAFGLALTIIRIARDLGGRAYSTGLYFGSQAEAVMGAAPLAAIKSFKEAHDPDDLFNPGKVVNGRKAGLFMSAASLFEPIVRRFGNAVTLDVGERIPTAPVRGIPADIAWYAYACSQCGYCVDACDQFYGRGWESQSPRGKWFWLREYMEGSEDWSQKMVDSFMACTTCELCDARCSAALPIESSWMKLRGQLINDEKRMTIPPFEVMSAALEDQGNIWAGYRENRADWFPEDLREKHGPDHRAPNVYFAGCTASYVENDIGIATVRVLDEAGVDFSYLGERELCCATPMLVAGKWDQFAEVMKENIANVKAAGADTVISSCPACDMMWRHAYPQWAEKLGIDFDIKARHYSEIVAEQIESGEFTFPENGRAPEKITWHDSCHIGRVSGIYEAPRQMAAAVPGAELVEMAHNREDALCCGSVLTLISDPLAAHDIGDEKLIEAEAVGAEKILALCPCCEFQLRVSVQKKGKEDQIEVVDLAHYAAEALGYPMPDPNPEVRAQWAVFEAMIPVMTPAGFAAIMEEMFPELIDAMPLGMGPMMKFMGRAKLAKFMKPMFPFLFPRLLPGMMPKVMGRMLELVGERIPMPDYLAEQMPEIMPRVMDNLMPHMLPDVIPLIAGPMIDHLEGRASV
jgi:Fe-S oxidoreductase/FAD/FMN-containing dehydrogenase